MNSRISPASVSAIVTRVMRVLLSARRQMMAIDRGQLARCAFRLKVLRALALGVILQLCALGIVNLALLRAIPLLHLLHVAVAAFFREHCRTMHQLFLGLDEVLAVEAPDARMHVGVHPDRVARTRLDA